MTYRPKGMHVTIDPASPAALGICDDTGFVFNRKDLVRKMEWRGNALVWTGFYVGRPYVDKPNEQLRPPMLSPDPVPIRDPRLEQPVTVTWSEGITETWGNLSVERWEYWGSEFDGSIALPENERLRLLQQANWSS